MKKLTAAILALSMIATPLSVLFGSAAPSDHTSAMPFGGGTFGGGNGTVWAPYLIEDVLDLQAMSGSLGANYTLARDIDASNTSVAGNPSNNGGRGFLPVGDNSFPFTGSFDGKEHSIDGLYLSGPWNYTGLFGYTLSSAKIENVRLDNVYINCWQHRGALVGWNNGGTIRNVSVSGMIGYASSNAGGLVGLNIGGLIDNCSSSCTVSSSNGNNIGGLVGRVYGSEKITNCSASGAVNGVDNVGGFVGAHSGDGSTIDHCTAYGAVSSTGKCIGGFAGQNYNGADIYNSSAVGGVSNTGPTVGILGTGGFVGSNYWSANGPTIIQFCYASGDVTGTVTVGGFAGSNGDTAEACIFDCYSLGDAHATSNTVGGFMGGGSEGPIMRCYSTGEPSATGGGVGGFAGYVGFATASNFQNNRWDTVTSGTASPISAGNSSQIFGNTTVQLLQQSTYNGSDFTNTWWMVDGQTRPFLRMEYGAEITNSHQLQMMEMDKAADYVLANDIDLGDIVEPSQMWGTSPYGGGGFVPVGNGTAHFTGGFEGNGYEISGLYINRSTQMNQSLLGWVYAPASVVNVNLGDVNVTGGQHTGGLVGYLYSGTVQACSAAGEVWGNGIHVGGLAGYNVFGTVLQCSFDGSVYSTANYVGGLIGRSTGAVADSGSAGTVQGLNWVGGLIGDTLNSGYVENCFSYSEVSGDMNVGGLVGWSGRPITQCHAYGDVSGVTSTGGLAGMSGSVIVNSSASGHVTGTNTPTGGLVGWNGADIEYSDCSGSVDGTSSVGGLVGQHASGNIMSSNATGDVTGSDIWIGGLVGNFDSGLISDCFAGGDVTGLSTVGGLVGTFDGGAITGSYATGEVTSLSSYAGGLVGWSHLGGAINNSNSFGYVHGSDRIGGFVGYNEVPIEFSNSFGPVASSSSNCGGFAGFNGAKLESCTAYGAVSGRTYTGGLVGYNGDSVDAKVLNCTAYGNVTNPSITDSCVGGLIGRNNAGLISNCRAHGNATSSGEYAGGLIGHNTGAVYQSCSHGNADSGNQNFAGGFIGMNTGSIEQCFSTGSATTTGSYAGGLIGQNGGGILNCYARGSASGDWFVGGFIGDNHQIIQNAYSTGNASGTGGNCGGFIGFNESGFAVTDSYWDLENSGTVPSDGGLPRSTAEMMSQATFTGWDLATVWGLYEANTYPFLRAFGIPPEPQADLEATLTDLADPVMFGDVLTYHAVLSNHGPGNAVDVEFNMTLPAEVTFINASGTVNVNGQWITGNPGTVPSGTAQDLFVNVTVNQFGGASTFLQLTCTASVTSTTDDPGAYPNSTVELTVVNRAPVCENKSWQTTEDYIQSIPAPGVLAGAYDPDLDPFTIISNEPSDYGAAVTILANGNFTYDPTVSATLQALHGGVSVYDTFNYTISDGRGGIATATITMQVDGQEGQPTAVNDTFTVWEDSGPNALTGVLSNDLSDEEGDTITISDVNVPWQGNATITGGGTGITFTPRENFFGAFTFTYWISDGHTGTSQGSINMTVTGVNDAPFITNVANPISMLENATYSYVYQGIDVDADTLTWTLDTNATWLSMNATTGNLSGKAPFGSAAEYPINITLSDGHGGADWYEFTLTVLADTDGDGIPDSTDTDDDGDGVPDTQDDFPLDPTETTDTDGDGIGNNADTDDDGDGIPDAEDSDPLVPNESVDTDGDGVPDSEDAFPTDPAASIDTDGDGMPDAWNSGYTADDSTTGLELDDDPLTPHEEGGNMTLYLIVIIIVIVVVVLAMLSLRPKSLEPADLAEESDSIEDGKEVADSVKTGDSDAEGKVDAKAPDQPPPQPEDPRIVKLKKVYAEGKMSREMYEVNLKKFGGKP